MKNKEEIHIFDLDDTLTVTPTFSEFVGAEDGEIINYLEYYPNYFKEIKSIFADCLSKEILFKREGDFVVPIDAKTKKKFSSEHLDYFKGEKYKKMFDNFEGSIVIKSFPGFHSDPSTIGVFINRGVKNIYDSVKNKMILTGRDESLRSTIEKNLKDINLSYPNYGLYLFSPEPKDGNNLESLPYNSIKEYKSWVIKNTIRKHGWSTVHFYEDRQDWLNYAKKTIEKTNPEVLFVPHLITNIKNSYSF